MRMHALWIPMLVLALTGCSKFMPKRVEVDWETDFAAARDRASREGKLVLLSFTQSDSAPQCKLLEEEVFSKEAFAEYAKAKLVLVKVDFPEATPISPAQQEANKALAREYGVRAYPRLILVDAYGEALGRTGYPGGGVVPMLAELTRLAAEKPALAAAAGFKLQGVSGRAGARLALINNRTLGEGEPGTLDRAGRKVEVRCLLITPDRVLVEVEGQMEPAVLYLSGRL